MDFIKKFFILFMALSFITGLVFTKPEQAKKQQVTAGDYTRALKMSNTNLQDLVTGEIQTRGWLEDGRLWFSESTKDGWQFFLTDPVKRTKNPAFDHVQMAKTLSDVTGKKVKPVHLPFKEIKFSADGSVIEFLVRGVTYKYNLKTLLLEKRSQSKNITCLQKCRYFTGRQVQSVH